MTHLAPYICCHDAAAAIAFYTTALGATETMRLTEPGGKIGHAEFSLGGATIMLSDEYPDYGARSPRTIGGTPVKLHLYVDDVDAVVARAAAAGATIVRAPTDQFYGDRTGEIEDPFGHHWMLATRKETVSTQEVQRRYDAMMKG